MCRKMYHYGVHQGTPAFHPLDWHASLATVDDSYWELSHTNHALCAMSNGSMKMLASDVELAVLSTNPDSKPPTRRAETQ